MNKKEYAQYHRDVCDSMIEITRQKNSDYCGAGDDPFKNFRQVEFMGICSVEQGFLTRMSDKMSRIASYVEQGTLLVKDESVSDTLKDLSNYCILMMGYLKSEADKKTQQCFPVKNEDLPPPIPKQVTSAQEVEQALKSLKDLPSMPERFMDYKIIMPPQCAVNERKSFRPELNLDMRRY